jgi:hypothetical protein
MILTNRRVPIDTEASMLEEEHLELGHGSPEGRCPLCQSESEPRKVNSLRKEACWS